MAEITERKIGVEIECVIPIIGRGQNEDIQSLLAEVLTNHGIVAVSRAYGHRPVDPALVAVEYDSSLQAVATYKGLRCSEIEVKTSPMRYDELKHILPTVLEVLCYFGARINYSCGFHVHHDLKEIREQPWIIRNLAHLWWRYHKVIYGLVAPSRKSNSYCRQPLQSEATLFDRCRTYEALRRVLSRCDRHQGLNFTNLADASRMTVEWRMHQGTTSWPKISAWILATQRWTEHAIARSCQYRPEPVPNTREGLDSMLLVTGFKPNSRVYPKVQPEIREVGRFLLQRWKHFNGTPGDDANADS